jgi:xanthine dehydrogenase accessory factor
MDLEVLHALRAWQESEQPVWLVTVVQTFGSSPRPPGAMLVLRGDGLRVGSVSGGCIEDDLSRRAQEGGLPSGRAETLIYGVTREEAQHFGLPCGGTLRLVVEPVRRAGWTDELLAHVAAQRLVRRELHLPTLRVTLGDAARGDGVSFDGERLVTVHGPRWRLLIIGAGQTSAYLAQMAQALDYQVLVCDPREEMRQTWNVPGTVLLTDMPDDAVTAIRPDAHTAIVALTHDPKLDDMALLEALKSPAFYVGALGSHRNNAQRRQRLALFDLSREEIDRLHGPVGLPIGSRTPPEIAVSILAHLISVRNQSARVHDLVAPTAQEVCS